MYLPEAEPPLTLCHLRCVGRRPKVRKAAYAAATEVLVLHAQSKVTALANHVADFAAKVLEGCAVNDAVPALHMLGFLQEVRRATL
jgi:hypothetical protein